MITTYFNQADIIYAYNEIRANGEQPILYCSSKRAADLIPFAGMQISSTVGYSGTGVNVDGYIGYFKGLPVYVTEEVGDLIVIVPQYKEEKVQ